jgi:secreted trypsin-like serine protease
LDRHKRATLEEKSMLTKLKGAVSALAIVALGIGNAAAISDGDLDGNGHPYVGLMVAQDAAGNPLWRCSGTLLSATIFLTAGHCTEAPAAHAEIWFAADVQSGVPANGYPLDGDAGGKTYTHPSYNPAAFYLYDLGVVVLDTPMKMKKYGALPKQDILDVLATQRGLQDVSFTAVGYGLQEINPVFIEQLKIRMVAYPNLIQINTGFTGEGSLLLSNNHSTGGTCFGDSGGPNFIDRSNVVGGVTSFGINGNCAGTGGVYRVDRADDLNWLYSAFGSQLR